MKTTCKKLAFCPINTEHDGCHELTMQTFVQEQQQADDIRRDSNSIDSNQAEHERFHGTGDSEIDGTNAELQKADAELAEDQAAIDNRQQLTGDALPSIIQFDNLENCIYQCAPGENYIPKYILLDDNFEVLAFPDLFQYGTGGYKCEDRPVNLSICKYFQQHLLNVDMQFAKNIEYLFCAQHMEDIKQIESDINLAIRLSKGRTVGGQKITPGLLHNPEAVQQLVRNEQAYKFLKNVRGSPACWQNELYDVLAMFHRLGIPTWFLTLSAADLHWPEIVQAVAKQCGRQLSRDDVLKMPIAERSKCLHQNPLMSSRMFPHRVESFFTKYLLSSAQPLGHIIDYVIKIGFQMHGSPHAHCLLWVQDAPKIDRDPDEVVCAFIDKHITATLPTKTHENEHDIKLKENFQKHTHSDYCHRNRSCHFGFPKPPAT